MDRLERALDRSWTMVVARAKRDGIANRIGGDGDRRRAGAQGQAGAGAVSLEDAASCPVGRTPMTVRHPGAPKVAQRQPWAKQTQPDANHFRPKTPISDYFQLGFETYQGFTGKPRRSPPQPLPLSPRERRGGRAKLPPTGRSHALRSPLVSRADLDRTRARSISIIEKRQLDIQINATFCFAVDSLLFAVAASARRLRLFSPYRQGSGQELHAEKLADFAPHRTHAPRPVNRRSRTPDQGSAWDSAWKPRQWPISRSRRLRHMRREKPRRLPLQALHVPKGLAPFQRTPTRRGFSQSQQPHRRVPENALPNGSDYPAASIKLPVLRTRLAKKLVPPSSRQSV